MKALFWRDMRLALRSGGGFGLGLAFYFMLALLFPFAVGSDPEVLRRVGPGVLWVGALLSTLLTLDRLFALDNEDGALDMLLTAPIPTEGLVLAKASAHWVTNGLPLCLLGPTLGLFFQIPLALSGWLLAALLIGTPALSMIGAFGASLTLSVKRGGLLLMLLVLPLYLPTLIFGAEVVRRASEGAAIGPALALLSGVSLAVWAVMPFVTASVLRASAK